MSNADLITQKVLQITDSLATTAQTITTAIVAKAPAALSLILNVARIDAITNIVQGFFAGLFPIIFIIAFIKIYKKGNSDRHYNGEMKDWYVFILAIGGFVGGIGAVVTSTIFFSQFLDVFSWVGIWHPDIYLAHQLLVKAEVQ